MDVVKSMAKDMIKEIGNKSREFYEFILPPIDMEMVENMLTVTIDIPGFNKKDIQLNLNSNILSIHAKKNETKKELVCNQRPNTLDKKIRLPVYIKEGEEKVTSAKYADGVLTVTIPITRKGKDISVE